MNERFIYLTEQYLGNKLTSSEQAELEKLINQHPELKTELSEQKEIKEAVGKMQLKNPSREFWDKYWISTYNRVERKFAWLLLIIGAVIILAFAAVEAVDQFIKDLHTPLLVKIGIAALTAGLVILLGSVIREKFSINTKDQYKEIQR